MSNESFPVAIIGFGTAGVNAAIGLRNAGYEGEICAFSDTNTLPYSPILTSYYAGGEKTYEECFPWSAAEIAELRVDVRTNCPVTRLDPAAHRIETSQGAFTYEKCIIAAGAHPTTVGFPPVEGYEPLVLRTLDDAERLKRTLEDPACQRVLVSGASMVALKALEACLRRDVQVTLVGMNPHVLDFNALPAAAERFERGLRAKGVELKLGQTIAAVECRESAAGEGAGSAENAEAKLAVTFSSGDVDAFDEIIVAHGVKSNLDFVTPGSLEVDRALVVDEFMRTSDADVYAVGDVAQALELVSGEKRVVGIWKTAAVQGAVAGAAVAAELAGRTPSPKDAYPGALPSNTIAVDGTLFISAGTVELAEGRHAEVKETDDMTVIYVFQDEADGMQRLVGFNVACDHDEAGSVAYDTGAMLTLRIEAGCRR